MNIITASKINGYGWIIMGRCLSNTAQVIAYIERCHPNTEIKWLMAGKTQSQYWRRHWRNDDLKGVRSHGSYISEIDALLKAIHARSELNKQPKYKYKNSLFMNCSDSTRKLISEVP